MTDSIDPTTVRWDIIDATIEALNGGGFNVQPEGYLFTIGPVGEKNRPYTPEFSPLGVLAIIANRIFANEIRDGSYAARFQHGFMELPGHTDPLDPDASWWCTTIGPLYAKAIFGTDQIPAGLSDFNTHYRYQAATCLEQWQRQLRVTHVRWVLQREMTSPLSEFSAIEYTDVPASYLERYERRHQAALDKMADLLAEEYPNATSIMVRAGDDFSPQAWEEFGDYTDREFYDLAMELEGKAVAYAMELHPDPDPFESANRDGDYYCLTVEDEGFTLYRNGNSDSRPDPSLRGAISSLFPMFANHGPAMEYVVGDTIVLCGNCMVDAFLSDIESYLDGSDRVYSSFVEDEKYHGDVTCENGHTIQPQLCPLCHSPLNEPARGEDGDYRVISSQTNGDMQIHGACLLDAEDTSDPDRQARQHVSREGLVYSVSVWGTRYNFIVDTIVEVTIGEQDAIVDEEEVN